MPSAPNVQAWRSPAAWAFLLAVTGAALALDLWTKVWAFRTVAGEPIVLDYEQVSGNPGYHIPWHPGMHVIPPDLLDFRLVLNHGAVFGIGQGRGPIFIAFTVLAVGTALWVFGRHTGARSRLSHVGLALVLAGGLGNMVDRVSVGAVRDFMHLFPRRELPFGLHWPGGSNEWFPWVFNVADMELIAGMALLMIAIQLSERRAKAAARSSPATPA
jgi:signal peptidase II